MTDPTVVAKRREAEAARADFAATLSELQMRLSPREMARNAMEVARDRGEDLAERSVEFARARPGAAAGLTAGAVALLVHRPILRGIGRLFRRKPVDPAHLSGEPIPRPAAPVTLPPAGNDQIEEIRP